MLATRSSICFVSVSLLFLLFITPSVHGQSDNNEGQMSVEGVKKETFVDRHGGFSPTELRGKNQRFCPDLNGKMCPDPTTVYYFECCGEALTECCMRFQHWVLVTIALAAVTVLVAIVWRCARCIFCK